MQGIDPRDIAEFDQLRQHTTTVLNAAIATFIEMIDNESREFSRDVLIASFCGMLDDTYNREQAMCILTLAIERLADVVIESRDSCPECRHTHGHKMDCSRNRVTEV